MISDLVTANMWCIYMTDAQFSKQFLLNSFCCCKSLISIRKLHTLIYKSLTIKSNTGLLHIPWMIQHITSYNTDILILQSNTALLSVFMSMWNLPCCQCHWVSTSMWVLPSMLCQCLCEAYLPCCVSVYVRPVFHAVSVSMWDLPSLLSVFMWDCC